ncbi:MAG: mechanosensitive ion channel family protein [Gemmatimonadaceae bacterium]|nr:mechanosensitive ion channel family protein [Gemmatimonadaceae bacterium]
MQSSGVDLHVVTSRLTEKLYQMLAAVPMLAIAMLLVWATWKLGGWLSRRALLTRAVSRNPFLRDLAQTTTRWVVSIVGIVVALDLLDATAVVGAILGTAGVFGLALGFAFKDTLENYLAGVLMSLRQPFAPHDEVVIDGHHGSVVSLSARATVLMTLDGNHLRIPNALVFRSVMLNYTRNPSRRFEFDVGVGVQEDLVEAQRLGIATLATQDGVMVKPPPRAFIQSLGDSNVQIRYFGWVDQRTHDFLAVRSESIRIVKLALEAAGMDMPEPIYRVQLSGAPTPSAATTITIPAASGAPRSSPTRSAHAGVDTSRISDLDEQIADDRKRSDSADLLSPTAPKE